ncbi:MAG: efflux transporter outer membrane subunit [Alphaproteobacteria bacterium]
MSMMTRFGCLLFIGMLTACSVTPDYERPQISASDWRGDLTATEEVPQEWWRLYGDSQLDELVSQGLQNNHSLKAALSRIDQARADLKIAGASLLPSVSLSASGAERAVLEDSGDSRPFTLTPQGGFATRDWIAGATISYELDLFGKNRARQESYAALLNQEQYRFAALRLVLTAEIARTYFTVLALAEKKGVADQLLKNAQAVLESLNADLATGRDVSRQLAGQQAIIAERAAAVAGISLAEAKARNALAALVGQAPQNLELDGGGLANVMVPPVAVVQPVQLLERRPDLKAAEAMLIAANADIGATKAALYPSINLGAGLAAAQPIIGSPSVIVALIGSITAPLFEGGRLRGQLDKAEARKLELTERYLQTVLEAYRETEDALATVKWIGAQARHRAAAAQSRLQVLQLAEQQFANGTISYRDFLRESDALLMAQDSQLTTVFAELSASVDLIKVLGGGWQETHNRNNC